MSAEWYYAKKGEEKSGPISADTLARIIATSSDSSSSTLVWRKGMADWAPASEIEELKDASESYKSPASDTITQSDSPYTTPSTYPAEKSEPTQVKPANFALYLGTQIVAIVTFIIAISQNLPEDPSSIQTQQQVIDFLSHPDVRQGTVIAALVYLFSTALSLIYLYRAWTTLGHSEPISPALIVALMCIPILNIGWRFIAYWKWSKRWNQEFSRTDSPLMPEGLFLASCITLAVVTVIPFVILGALPLMWLSVYYMCRAINHAAS